MKNKEHKKRPDNGRFFYKNLMATLHMVKVKFVDKRRRPELKKRLLLNTRIYEGIFRQLTLVVKTR